MYERLVGVQTVHGGWLTDLHFSGSFPSSLHLYEWCEYFTMNVHDLKNQEKKIMLFSLPSPTQKKKGNIFLAGGKCFPCCFYFIPSPQQVAIECLSFCFLKPNSYGPFYIISCDPSMVDSSIFWWLRAYTQKKDMNLNFHLQGV